MLLGCLLPAKANIFASNIKLNGDTNSAVLLPNGGVAVSYILNEPATNGVVTLKIFQNTNLIRSISAIWPNPGTLRGSNGLTWDGVDARGNAVTQGVYSASLTASTAGYNGWTQTSDDTNPGNLLYDPYGIAVNNNTNSLFYGRIFVGNAMSIDVPGQQNGVYKFNADGSAADEGDFGNVNYAWAGHMGSPWKLEVSQDDLVYVNDWSSYGLVLAFNQVFSTYTTILDQSNWLVNGDGSIANLSGPGITGTGPNTGIWMADVNAVSDGVVRWGVTANGAVATGDQGTCVIAAGAGSGLSEAPWDVTVDTNGFIYVIQSIVDTTDPAPRVLCFPPFAGGSPLTNAVWEAGAGPDSLDPNVLSTVNVLTNLDYAFGISVNPAASYVAVAVRGIDRQNGGLTILDAATGDLVVNLDGGLNSSYMDVAWDRVGNVYGTQEEMWRVFSPPGANQSTTVVLPVIQKLDSLMPPLLSAPQALPGQMQFTLQGQNNVTYLIQSSTNLVDWTNIATNCSPVSTRFFQLTPSDDASFYRAVITP